MTLLTEEERQSARIRNVLWSVRITLIAANRGRLYRQLYSPSNTSEEAFAGLLVALQNLYAGLLDLLARVGSPSSAARDTELSRAIANPARAIGIIGKLRALIDRLEESIVVCERTRETPVDTDTRKLLDSIPQIRLDLFPLDKTEAEDERDAGNSLDYDKDTELLDWLSDLPFEKHHRKIQSRRTNGTCEWILQQQEFQDWRDRPQTSTLWLHGSRT